MNKFSLSGIAAGIIFSVFSAYRYFVLYPDLDRALVYVLIGLTVAVVSYLYNLIKDLHFRLEGVENWLSESEYNKTEKDETTTEQDMPERQMQETISDKEPS